MIETQRTSNGKVVYRMRKWNPSRESQAYKPVYRKPAKK